MILNNREANVDPLVELDGQQLALLEVLRRSGWSASFSELRDAGIEFPASIVEELELIGLPLERRAVRRGALASPGVRLRPVTVAEPPYPLPDLVEPPPPSAPAPRTPVLPRIDRRAAPLLLAAMLVLVLVLALTAGAPSHGGSHPSRAVATRTVTTHAHARASVSGHPRVHKRVVARTPPAHAAVAERPPAVAAELQASGHALLESGRGSTAAARLSEALRATGERVADCIEPASEACFTYAYALYDLGRALALEGRSAQAAAVLQQRLRIDNQREAVASALAHVHAAARPPVAHPPARRPSAKKHQPLMGGVQAPA